MSLWLLESVGYWDTDDYSRRLAYFSRGVYKHGSIVQTKPIYLITTRDGVWGENIVAAFKNRYEQEETVGVGGYLTFPMRLSNSSRTYKVSFFEKLFRIIGLLGTLIFWPSSFFILTVGARVFPVLINPQLKRTVLGYLLPQIAGGYFDVCSLICPHYRIYRLYGKA